MYSKPRDTEIAALFAFPFPTHASKLPAALFAEHPPEASPAIGAHAFALR